jgi:hypothetical protein
LRIIYGFRNEILRDIMKLIKKQFSAVDILQKTRYLAILFRMDNLEFIVLIESACFCGIELFPTNAPSYLVDSSSVSGLIGSMLDLDLGP